MKKALTVLMAVVTLVTSMPVKAEEMPIEGTQEIKVTAYYTNNPDAICASGCEPRYGIMAGPDWMLNDRDDGGTWVAMLWTLDGSEFLGYFEVLDRGGTDAIRDGYVLDVFEETYSDCKDFMTITEGKCLVKYVKSYG